MNVIRRNVIHLLRRVVGRAGGVLLSRSVHEQILAQRAGALAELVAAEAADLTPGIACIVFSKDRALQLHALLYSYFNRVANPAPVYVIYTASSQAHQKSYDELVDIFSGQTSPVHFIGEMSSFKQTLLSVLGYLQCRSVMFLVDDLIFIRDVDFAIASVADPTEVIVSLRHSPHLRRSYTADVPQRPPVFRESLLSSNLIEFNWFEQGNEWSDPWSVDGQVLSLAEVRVISRVSNFGAPNSYENCLKTFNDIVANRKGLCFRESIILNLPINRVQTEIANLSGNVSVDVLLEHWNRGLALDTSMFDEHIPISPHEEHLPRFVVRA